MISFAEKTVICTYEKQAKNIIMVKKLYPNFLKHRQFISIITIINLNHIN